MDTKITILIPNYNKEKYISQALSSVLAQKTSFKYKLLIIDDASTDKSVEIINKYIKKYPHKIDFIKNKKNLRCLATSIKGYEKIKTEYFCVLDPDDYWIDKNKLQKAIDFLDQHKDFTIYIANNYIEEKNKKLTPYFNSESKNFDFNDLNNAIFGHTSGTIFRNIIFIKNIPKAAYNAIGTKDEKVYEGDSFRNVIHLEKGKAHFENNIESVYRITGNGIWTSLNEFQQNSLNVRFYLKMFLYFKKKSIFFINMSYHFCKKNIDFLNKKKSKMLPINNIFNWQEILIKCFEVRNKLFSQETDDYLSHNFMFFLPSRTVGGYEYLFIRLSKFLSEKLNFNVYYIDYQDGFAKNQLNKTKVKFINYIENETQINIDQPVNLIAPITMGHQIPNLKNPSSKIIFWCAHPKSVPWLAGRSGFNDKKLNKFLSVLNQQNSVCFMDWACWQSTNFLSGISFQETYVPISTNEKKNIKKTKKIIKKNEINIGWLGRLDSDKICSLINLLDNFYNLKTKLKKTIHIIGDGNSKYLIDDKKYSKKINIIFTSTLINEKLYRYLTNNVDVLFAMGTSTLEAASLKIPSVLTISGIDFFKSDIYIWLYNSKKFSLGFYNNQNIKGFIKTNSFNEIIKETYYKNNKEKIGSKCYEYYKQNHSILNTISNLLYFTVNNNFTYDKYQKLLVTLKIKKMNLRINTRLKLIEFGILLILNQIPIVNKFLLNRDEILKKINKTIEDEKNS